MFGPRNSKRLPYQSRERSYYQETSRTSPISLPSRHPRTCSCLSILRGDLRFLSVCTSPFAGPAGSKSSACRCRLLCSWMTRSPDQIRVLRTAPIWGIHHKSASDVYHFFVFSGSISCAERTIGAILDTCWLDSRPCESHPNIGRFTIEFLRGDAWLRGSGYWSSTTNRISAR